MVHACRKLGFSLNYFFTLLKTHVLFSLIMHQGSLHLYTINCGLPVLRIRQKISDILKTHTNVLFWALYHFDRSDMFGKPSWI